MSTVYPKRFEGRRAVITGGAAGIGLTFATRFVAEGGSVSLWDISQPAIDAAVAALGAKASGIRVDVADWAQVEAAATQAAAALGGIDVLVASAGITGPNVPLAEYPVDQWRQVMDVNLNGLFHCNRAVVPYMLAGKYGRIVNIASVAGKEGNPNASAYSASKAGVIGLTKSLGKELAKSNITVNAVTPAAVRTAIFDQMTPQHIEFMLSKIPMGRFGAVDEIAAVIGWLASEECSFTTGSVFDASGGRATY
ncbi:MULTISPECIES: SDR family NAD(P)-dependent oxidoreductase [unclassified Variovorax]|jgi:3-oxoacyl-[acyl-carrier protein] reductase|uniref:SDR family NAD(P)-dependent oxidoreductase n=1 Tax=unclassified Variovorax TaxID=663243 RepID=UPI002576B2EA|nr:MULTISPECIES: SDR family NAD(P)-dependent oxidoreductase [unclassified Variovorax]MDM0086188.1 SDR family NAD(P)-dependent oxidoreductase [Variovorax sp. J22G40]MDM0145555.1 SDR family NAD(P)-dependent oxidoreductase [Variovorax sp. J2P1-31]